LKKSTNNKARHFAVTPVLSYLGPLRPKYFPQRPIPKHNQSIFFPQFELPIFTQQAALQLYYYYYYLYVWTPNGKT